MVTSLHSSSFKDSLSEVNLSLSLICEYQQIKYDRGLVRSLNSNENMILIIVPKAFK